MPGSRSLSFPSLQMHETPLSFRRLAAFSLCTGLLAWPITAEDPTALRAVELEVCQEIVDFECQGTDRAFGPDVEIVAFLTRIDGATGTAFVEHVWTQDGKEVRRVRLPIKTSSYRTWS